MPRSRHPVPDPCLPRTAGGRIPALDGLRAISIALVVLAHLRGTRGFPLPLAITEHLDLGNLGVRVFFVISGFLITSLLLEEQLKTHKTSLRQFYLRRTFRIFPPYIVFLLVVLGLWAIGHAILDRANIVYAWTYTMNYNRDRDWIVGHTWSLAVEEQFYLLWPLTLALLGVRRAIVGAMAFFACAPLIRTGLYLAAPPWYPYTGYNFEVVADAIAIGCVLAATRQQLSSIAAYRRFLASPLFIVVPLTVLAAAALPSAGMQALFGIAVMNLGIAACIDWCMHFPAGRIGRFLNTRVMVFIGLTSYSIYLWQQPFLDRTSDSLLCRFPVNLIGLMLAAVASYELVEKPAMRLRRRVEAAWLRKDVEAVSAR